MIVITTKYKGKRMEFIYKGQIELYIFEFFLWIDNNGYDGNSIYTITDAFWLEDIVSIEGRDA
jgi:hypothetical protein